MGVEELPNSGNKFTGSRMIVPGVGLNTFRVQKNDKFAIRRNPFANSINASPTPTPSITPTNTPTPSVTPTMTPTPSSSPLPIPQTFTFNTSSLDAITIQLSFSSSTFSSGGYVDWGDSSSSNITTFVQSLYSHVYSSPYTGQITINYYGNIQIMSCSSGTPLVSTSIVFDSLEISNLVGLQSLSLSSRASRLEGQISDLNTLNTLTALTISNDYTSSNLSDIPVSVKVLSLGSGGAGYTTISGDLSSLSSNNLTTLVIGGTNTVFGDLSTLPSTLLIISIQGNNTVSGDTLNFNFPNLTQVTVWGDNTIGGDVANLPPNITAISMIGDNTLYGNLSDFPSSLTTILLSAPVGGLITGDLSDLPNSSYSQLLLTSNNFMISANTATIPVITSATFHVKIKGSLTGDLSNIFNVGTDFPSCTFILDASNASPCSLTYTSGLFPWGSLTMNTITLYTSTNLTNTEIDNLLIDIDSYGGGATWVSCVGNPSYIILNGTRTAASDAAVTSLNGKGVTVTVTP